MNPNKNDTLFFAEIIQSSLTEWTGQCWKWNQMPQFGSLLKTETNNTTIFGIVHTITTGSFDPVQACKAYQKTEEELLRDQPEIFYYLQTTFNAACLGYIQSNRLFYNLPPTPAKMHSFITECTLEEYQQFFNNEQFLHLLINQTQAHINIEELLLAIFKHLHTKKLLHMHSSELIFHTVSNVYKNDYQKLKTFLNRIEYLLSQPIEINHV